MGEMKETNLQWLGSIPSSWELKKIKYVLKERIEKNNPIRTDYILSLTAKQGVIPYDEKEGVEISQRKMFPLIDLHIPEILL